MKKIFVVLAAMLLLAIISCSSKSSDSASTTPSISGTITMNTGEAFSGVTVTLSDTSSATTTTDSNGKYSFSNLTNGPYIVTPSITGYTFTFTEQVVTISGASASDINFTETPLTGIFSGSASDSTGPGSMIWDITQTNTSISGSVTGSTPLGTVVFSGSISGTISGTTLDFTITVPVGGISGYPSCSVTLSGTATDVTDSTISGTYTGNNSCTGPFTNGELILTKQ